MKDIKINYLTVHVSSGLTALKAVKKVSGSTKIIGVTTLTSLNNKDLKIITTNLKGALTDAQPIIDKVGNTIGNTISNLADNFKDIGSNFLDIGKAKRIKSEIATVSYTHLTLPTSDLV